MIKKKRLTLILTNELIDEVTKFCRSSGISKNVLVERAIRKMLNMPDEVESAAGLKQ